MKKIFTIIAGLLSMLSSTVLSAQSFHVDHDTVSGTPVGLFLISDRVTPVSTNVTLQWKVKATNFPADWIPGLGICDNFQCYTSSSLWPSPGLNTSAPYTAGVSGDFHLQITEDAATTLGTYYVTVRMNDAALPADTATETYIVSKLHPTAATVVRATSDNIVLYPNPASNEVNVVFDASLNVNSVAVYNIIGRIMSVYKVSSNGANLPLTGMPSGIYFVRLVNQDGNVVATKRFTKE